MTVKELKLFLSDKPEGAICFFTIWDGLSNDFELRPGYGKKLFYDADGKPYLKLGHSDNCKAHMIEKELK